MNRKAYVFCSLVLTLAGLAGCSSQPTGKEAKKAGTAPDKIQGKAQILLDESTSTDAALNAGGPSVYLWEGLRRYRLFFRKAVQIVPGKEYIAEGVFAQRVIDEIGDPDQGKNGYPLQSSCDRVVRMAWSGLAFDETDGHISVLRARVKRYPARPVLLVTRLTPVPSKEGGDASAEAKKVAEAEEKDIPEVSVAADKQRALLIEGPTVLPAPLWEPAGGTVRCKVIIGKEGKISELETGAQLCEIAPWSQFRYQPPVQGGRPVKVKTEVEVRYEPRK
ncbi:MAG: hypothetical protein Q8N47_25070 [Bryobacterales bacterium]|nr:hypothetical protein [Bryobacterales bacterium]